MLLIHNNNKKIHNIIICLQNLSCTAPIVPTKMLGDAEELDRHLVLHGYSEVATYSSDYFIRDISNVKVLKIMKVYI